MLEPAKLPEALARALTGKTSRRLGAFLRQVFASTGGGDQARLPPTPEVFRALARLGAVRGTSETSRLKEYEDLVRRASRGSGEAPGKIDALLRAFSSPVPGLVDLPLCGAEPQCHECVLRGDCRHFAVRTEHPLLPPEELSRRLLEADLAGLRPEEILAPALRGDGVTVTALKKARALLDRAGGVRGLFSSRPMEWIADLGLSPSDAVRLQAILGLFHLWVERASPVGKLFSAPEDFYNHFFLRLRDLRKEVFYAVVLDQKHRRIDELRISEGTLTESLVHPREVFGPALRLHAAAIALVHNHPSGDPAPSHQDLALTRRLVQVAELVGIRVLDHVIIGDKTLFSFADKGLL